MTDKNAPMTVEAKKEVIRKFLHGFQQKAWGNRNDPYDLDRLLSPLADDCDWWLPTNLYEGGRMTKERFKVMLQAMDALAAGPLVVTLDAWTIEGERIALQAHSHVPLKNGKAYENFYHYLIEVHGGKITKFYEYCDLAATVEAFGGGGFVK